ncbi:MAG: helix-turn-helix domain-containing protein [Novosphingobium sp.]|nr:helix-turn-helix domain-containing protein [Novosphingobium sp.]MCP5402937.1 helix-turn-helix domain-containing protein [Novosphingobium sp.]
MPSDARFADEIAALMMIWGVPQTPARLFGHLLLQPEPVSLDDLAQQLGIGKSTASDAARLMERYGFLRRHGEPGTKRIFYGPSDDFTAFFLTQASYLERMAKVMGARIGDDLAPAPAQRLGRMAEYYDRLSRAMRDISSDYP